MGYSDKFNTRAATYQVIVSSRWADGALYL